MVSDRAPAANTAVRSRSLGLATWLAGLCGAALVGLSRLPFSFAWGLVKHHVYSTTQERVAALYAQFVPRALGIGLLLLAAAVILFVFRRRLALVTAPAETALAGSFRQFGSDLRALLRRLAEDRLSLLLLAILSLIGLAIRIRFLSEPVRCDETQTLDSIQRGIVGVFYYAWPGKHVLHTACVFVAVKLFGDGLWVLRLPAMLAGTALIPLSYVFVRVVFGRRGGLVAAALTAVAPYLVYFSVNGRGYTMVSVFTLLALMLCRYAVNRHSWAAGLLFALAGALGMFTVPIMLFPLAGCGLLMLALAWRLPASERRRALVLIVVATIVCGCLTVVCYLPVMVVSGVRALVSNKQTHPMAFPVFALHLPATMVSHWRHLTTGLPSWVLALIVLPGLVHMWRQQRALLCYVVTIPCGLLFVAVAMRVFGFPRLFLYLLPLWFALVDLGVETLVDWFGRGSRAVGRAVPALAAAVLVILGIHATRASFAGNTITETGVLKSGRDIVLYLKPLLREGDRILCITPSQPILTYYFAREGVPPEYMYTRSPKRLFVIVQPQVQTLQEVRSAYPEDDSLAVGPRITIGEADVYLPPDEPSP